MHHEAGLRKLLDKEGWSDRKQLDWLEKLKGDYTALELSAADRAMLDYAMKLTSTPGLMEAADVEVLRGTGFDDRAIHDICAITSYFAFVNRIADGLGVELEDDVGN